MPAINPAPVSSPSMTPTMFEPVVAPSVSTSSAAPVDSFERVGIPSAANDPSGLSALQKHVMFFDRNQDGKITLSETFDGFRALGFDVARSSAFSLAINAGLGSATGAPWYAPLTITVANIAAGKHASDSDIYDDNGDFSEEKFKELFATYDTDGDDALSAEEFEVFYARNKEDSVGSLTSTFEFGLLLEIAGEKRMVNGQSTDVVTRKTMERFYDGSLFFNIAGEPLPF